MSRIQLIKDLFGKTYPVFDGIVADLTLDEVKLTYPGTRLNTIAQTYAHTVIAEDLFIQERINGGVCLYDSGDWSMKVGEALEDDFFSAGWSANLTEEQWSALKEYARHIRAATEKALDTITEAELDRPVTMHGTERTVGYVLSSYAHFHLLEHTGEMAVLKGLLGKQGLPD